MFKPKAKTLPQMLATAVVRSVLVTAAFAIGFLSLGTGATVASPDDNLGRPPAVGSPAFVFDKMGDKCWTGEPPADMVGVIPGHVVYAKGDTGAIVGGEKVVGQALDQIFNDRDFGLTIYAFCR